MELSGSAREGRLALSRLGRPSVAGVSREAASRLPDAGREISQLCMEGSVLQHEVRRVVGVCEQLAMLRRDVPRKPRFLHHPTQHPRSTSLATLQQLLQLRHLLYPHRMPIEAPGNHLVARNSERGTSLFSLVEVGQQIRLL